MLLDVLQQRLLILREPEEVGRLAHPLHLLPTLRVRALPVLQILLVEERLIRHAVPPVITAEIQVAVVAYLLEERLHRAVLPRLARADEIVVRDIQPPPILSELRRDAAREFQRVLPLFLGEAQHAHRVLVGPRAEQHLLPPHPMIPGQHVAGDRGIRRPDRRDVVDVIDGGGDVELHHGLRE